MHGDISQGQEQGKVGNNVETICFTTASEPSTVIAAHVDINDLGCVVSSSEVLSKEVNVLEDLYFIYAFENLLLLLHLKETLWLICTFYFVNS